jgi:hypothetical protein
MQKVVGSSPIIRSQTACKTGGCRRLGGQRPNPRGKVEVWIVAFVDDRSQPIALLIATTNSCESRGSGDQPPLGQRSMVDMFAENPGFRRENERHGAPLQ